MRAEIVTIKCGNCDRTADVVTVGEHEVGVEWNAWPPGWFDRLGSKSPFRPRTFVCSRTCLLRVLEHEAAYEASHKRLDDLKTKWMRGGQ